MQDVLQQAETYKRTYAIVGRVHYIAGDRALALNRWLGIPVIVITAVVGTTVLVQRKSEFWPAILSWMPGVLATNC